MDTVPQEAIDAGWDPADGPCPNVHGKAVPALAVTTRLEDILELDGKAIR